MIYYVEDDKNVRELALYAMHQANLEAEGFSSAADFFDALAIRKPDAVLLDIMLPEVDGLSILAQLRADENTALLPVMMVTAKGSEFDTVSGLDAGADDYLTKPFGMMELISRVKALLRRSAIVQANVPTSPSSTLQVGSIELDTQAHIVTVAGVEVDLTLKEFDLLHELMRHVGCVLSRDQLLERVWSVTFAGGTRTVDVHIQTLRSKLAAAQEGSDALIKTVRGVGYAMQVG